MYHSIEICAGAGGKALGLEMVGFAHTVLVEYEKDYCECLKSNRPEWNVLCQNVHQFNGRPYNGQIDPLSGGVSCPPFSIAGKRFCADDERDLFPQMLRLVQEINPRAVMIENVRGLLGAIFDAYRAWISDRLNLLGYNVQIQLLNASDYGVPQLRPRVIILGIHTDLMVFFEFPPKTPERTLPVGEILYDLTSAKWTMRSDRAQNSRTEALGLIRSRKGRLPHVVVVTGEPMPSRLASLALGTGDIDCVYHFALHELVKAGKDVGAEDSIELSDVLISGKRIKGISDLPLDLTV